MFLNKDFASLPPLGDDTAPSGRQYIRLANTGTTESVNDAPLTPQRMYSLVVGAGSVRVSFRANAGISNAVATTDMLLPANSIFTFQVEYSADQQYGSRFVYIQAGDGSSAYEAFIIHSGR